MLTLAGNASLGGSVVAGLACTATHWQANTKAHLVTWQAEGKYVCMPEV